MNQLLSIGTVEEMIATACKLVTDKGLMTRNTELFEAAEINQTLLTKGNRIFPSVEALVSCMTHLKQNRISAHDIYENQHGWPDVLIDRCATNDLVIKLTDLPYQFCDHRLQQIIPLTREHVIEGTKLLHSSIHLELLKYWARQPSFMPFFPRPKRCISASSGDGPAYRANGIWHHRTCPARND